MGPAQESGDIQSKKSRKSVRSCVCPRWKIKKGDHEITTVTCYNCEKKGITQRNAPPEKTTCTPMWVERTKMRMTTMMMNQHPVTSSISKSLVTSAGIGFYSTIKAHWIKLLMRNTSLISIQRINSSLCFAMQEAPL